MSGQAKGPSKPSREQRLGDALRENLKRRKDQARGRRPAPGRETAAEPARGERPARRDQD